VIGKMGIIYNVGIVHYSVCGYYGGDREIGGKGRRREKGKEKKGREKRRKKKKNWGRERTVEQERFKKIEI
jgi:hypothetical protein